jgi:hypothetical protein
LLPEGVDGSSFHDDGVETSSEEHIFHFVGPFTNILQGTHHLFVSIGEDGNFSKYVKK